MQSSVVARYEYNAGSATLTVRYISGKVYNYLDVPEKVYLKMRSAMSKGRFLNKYIKGRYTFAEATPAGIQ